MILKLWRTSQNNQSKILKRFNLKAIATAADPSEGKNWLKFEKEKSIFQILIKIIRHFFEKVLENLGDSFGKCSVFKMDFSENGKIKFWTQFGPEGPGAASLKS